MMTCFTQTTCLGMQEHSGDGISYDPVMLWWPLTCVNAMEIDVVGKVKTVRSHDNIMMIGNGRNSFRSVGNY
jgi:hypothetical protein